MEFSRPEYWSGWFLLEIPSPGNLPNPGIELRSPTLQADSLPSEPIHLFRFTTQTKGFVCSLFLHISLGRISHSYGEGNDTPLQYSWLENPMDPIDGGAW